MSGRPGEGRRPRGERTSGAPRNARDGLDVRVERYGPHVRVLTVSGPLTGDRADRLCRAVRDQLALVPRLLVLEMTGVTAVDTAGVRVLVRTAHLAGEAAIRLALVSGASTAVGAVLELNGLAELFEVGAGVDQVVTGPTPEGTRASARRR